MLVIRAGIQHILLRIANSNDTDQIASSASALFTLVNVYMALRVFRRIAGTL